MERVWLMLKRGGNTVVDRIVAWKSARVRKAIRPCARGWCKGTGTVYSEELSARRKRCSDFEIMQSEKRMAQNAPGQRRFESEDIKLRARWGQLGC